MKKIFNPLICFIGRKIERSKFSEPPVLITGCPRSGTTMLLAILSAHPHIYAIQKQTYAFDSWKKKDSVMVPDRLDRLYRNFFRFTLKKTAKRWCEKTPKHLENIGNIRSCFPEYKIIHLVRDGRDIITSKHPNHKPEEYWVPQQRWIDYIELGLKYRNDPNVFTIRYEDIIFDYKNQLNHLLSFLGEDYTQEMENWYNNAGFKKSKHLKNGVRELYTKSVKRWQQKEHESIVKKFMDNRKAVELLRELKYI